MLTNKHIIELISQGENSSIEFKSKDVRAENVAHEIIAFSNSNGGTILIGIEDNKSITGIDNSKNYEEWAMNVARNNVTPPVDIAYSTVKIDNRKIIAIQVPKGNSRPYQDQSGRFYVRVGSTNRLASLNELMRLFQQSGFYHYDITTVEKANFASLNQTSLDQYFKRYDVDFSDMDQKEKITLLKNTDILADNDKTTIAGLLVFGIVPQRFIHNASISFAHFDGDEISETLIDKQNIEGPLDNQINTTLSVIKNNILTPSEIRGAKRVDQITYPDKVFRELLVNACVHRNYSIAGSRIRILMFKNRIEFISPGRLPNTITIEKLKAGVSYAVNPVILKFMENLRFIDKLGRGLPMVYQEANKLNKQITFEEIGEEFKVSLFF